MPLFNHKKGRRKRIKSGDAAKAVKKAKRNQIRPLSPF